jgi:hypothetical protein
MSQHQSLSEVLADQINQVSNGVQLSLNRHIRLMPSAPTLSTTTKAQITKRVPPKQLQKYLTLEMAISLLALEIVDLGTRISHYQHIERYRDHFTAPNTEVRAAFVMHTHILRGSEIYVIMERCKDCLDFFYELACDLDLGGTKMSRKMETCFKKEFERHLRERHRIVHAHERPSLVSRMVGIPPEDIQNPIFAKTFEDTIGTLAGLLHSKIGDEIEGKSPDEAWKAINDLRLKAVDEECFKMWSIFLDHINRLIDRSRLLKDA